jgi:ubiquinone/menaquinone biosynthesis C-methylase UbiE
MNMSSLEKWFVNSERRQRRRREQARGLLARIPLAGVRDFLEIGCGAGAVSSCAAQDYGLKVTGIDIDAGQIALAVEHARDRVVRPLEARFLQADAALLPFKDQAFDVVLTFMATHHVARVADALTEMRRVLRPDGHLVYADVFLPGLVAAVGAFGGHAYYLPRPQYHRAEFDHQGLEQV